MWSVACAQVLYLDIAKDAEHERLLAFAKAVRDYMQQAGVLVTMKATTGVSS